MDHPTDPARRFLAVEFFEIEAMRTLAGGCKK
jgi:hypothetical protein